MYFLHIHLPLLWWHLQEPHPDLLLPLLHCREIRIVATHLRLRVHRHLTHRVSGVNWLWYRIVRSSSDLLIFYHLKFIVHQPLWGLRLRPHWLRWSHWWGEELRSAGIINLGGYWYRRGDTTTHVSRMSHPVLHRRFRDRELVGGSGWCVCWCICTARPSSS